MSFLRSYLDHARGKKGFSLWMLLNPLHGAAKLFALVRNAAYDRGILKSIDPCLPVVSIGNLCYGGTNKTPMVEMIARKLHDHGLAVGIVSRGYGGAAAEPMWIGQNERSQCRSVVGDEPLMLAHRFPEARVVVSADRLDGINLLASLGTEIAVADDAFQHRRMGRDVDIVLVDATCPLGNGLMAPAGILREPPESLVRADFVILTKVDQVTPAELKEAYDRISRWVTPEKLFTARVSLQSWLCLDGEKKQVFPCDHVMRGQFLAFSAIGNPDSFHRSLDLLGVSVVKRVTYRDHHCFSLSDLSDLDRAAAQIGADGFVCTEKDLHNLPKNIKLSLPVFVPRITVALDREEELWEKIVKKLRPQLIVASNGYGEDAIGSLLAQKLAEKFPLAEVSAFALVGGGKQYEDRGIPVISPPSDMPSAGVIKYSLRALMRDVRHGLWKDISLQLKTWKALRGKIRTPLCVGDVYLMMHVLWGQGLTPLLLATAKSVYLTGHWPVERFFLKRRCLRVWTRDEETALELQSSGVEALFSGNPIMDIAGDNNKMEEASPWDAFSTDEKVLLLPGSRPRAYEDIQLLLTAAMILLQEIPCQFVLVPAPTLDINRLLSGLLGWSREGDSIFSGSLSVRLHCGSLAAAAREADLLLGLGGTANQVCAGLGVPVVSIIEKGKLVQKKLLQDAELLAEGTPEALSEAAVQILKDPERRGRMSAAGIRRLGGAGALNSVVEYAERQLGWGVRHRVYSRLCGGIDEQRERASACKKG